MTADERFAPGLPRAADRAPSSIARNEVMTGPVSDWATDFSHLEPEYAAGAIEIWDDLRRALPDRAHRPVRRRLAADPVRGRRRDRLRHRALLVAVDHHGQLPAAAGDGARSATSRRSRRTRRSTTTRASCCCRRSPRPRVGKQEASTRAFCHALIDGFDGTRRRRRGRRVRPAHPGAGHRGHARVPAGGRADSSRCSSRTCSRASTCRSSERMERTAGLFDYLVRADPRPRRANPRDDLTSYLLERGAVRPASSNRCTSAGTIALLLIAGIDTTWSAIGASLWHLAGHARATADGWSPNPSCCRRRWRSSCAPTRR